MVGNIKFQLGGINKLVLFLIIRATQHYEIEGP